MTTITISGGDSNLTLPGNIDTIVGGTGVDAITISSQLTDVSNTLIDLGSGTDSLTLGNFNNRIGLPLTLGATSGREDFLVLELGMSAPGEICELVHIARVAALVDVADEEEQRGRGDAMVQHLQHAAVDPNDRE